MATRLAWGVVVALLCSLCTLDARMVGVEVVEEPARVISGSGPDNSMARLLMSNTAFLEEASSSQRERVWFHLDDYMAEAEKSAPPASMSVGSQVTNQATAPAAELKEETKEQSKDKKPASGQWFHLDEFLEQSAQVHRAPVVDAKNKHKKGGTTVLANRNYMSVMEDAKGKGVDWKAAKKEAQTQAQEEAKKKENEAFVKRQKVERKRKLAEEERKSEREVDKKRVAEEVKKAQEQAGKVNNRKRQEHQKEIAKKQAEEEKERKEKVILADGWMFYGGVWQEPVGKLWGSVCVLSGLIKGQGRYIGRLPSFCRPKRRVMFCVNQGLNARTARVDVLADGRMFYIVPNPSRSAWLTLDGITFDTSPGKSVALLDGWQHYGGSWLGATQREHSGVVFMSGLIRGGQWKYLASVPRPSNKLMFAQCNHGSITRVDVSAPSSGEAKLNVTGGSHNHGWVSLNGLIYAQQGGQPLPLVNGWKPYGDGFRKPRVRQIGNFCLASGSVLPPSTNWPAHIATLPANCRPKKRLLFTVASGDHTARLDVTPQGSVFFISYGGTDQKKYLSLDGIRFTIQW